MINDLFNFVINTQRIVNHVFLGKITKVLKEKINVKLIEIKDNKPQESFDDTMDIDEFGVTHEEIVEGAEFVMVDGYYCLPNNKKANFNYIWFEY